MTAIAIETIQAVTADHFGLTVAELNSPMRARRFCRPRQVAMTLSRLLTKKSFPEIGRYFGDRDHSTVISGVQRIADYIETDAEFKKDFEALYTSLLPLANKFGDLSPFAKKVAPIIAAEIDKNFTIQLALAKAEHEEHNKTETVVRLFQSEYFKAIEQVENDYLAYETAKFSRGEAESLKRFTKSFEKFRNINRKIKAHKLSVIQKKEHVL